MIYGKNDKNNTKKYGKNDKTAPKFYEKNDKNLFNKLKVSIFAAKK